MIGRCPRCRRWYPLVWPWAWWSWPRGEWPSPRHMYLQGGAPGWWCR